MKRANLLTTILCLSTLAACGDGATISTGKIAEKPGSSGSVVPGAFKLYERPDAHPSPECDVHVNLKLINGYISPVATLTKNVEGICELTLDIAPLVFNLDEVASGCGSRRYLGGDFSRGDGAVVTGVEVIDNRHRVCKDRVPAAIVVKETFGDGSEVTLFSNASTMAAEPQTYQGAFVAVAAIGAESTGHALQLADGTLVELDLVAHGLQARFSEGKRAEVTGRIKEVTGVETGTRKVLVVETLTLL